MDRQTLWHHELLSEPKGYFQDTAISPRLGWLICFLLPTFGFLFCILLLAKDWKEFLISCAFASVPLFAVIKLLIFCYEAIIHVLCGKKRENRLSDSKERWNKSVKKHFVLATDCNMSSHPDIDDVEPKEHVLCFRDHGPWSPSGNWDWLWDWR